MTLIIGDAALGTGLAGAIATERKKVCPQAKISDMAPSINADAKAIIDYLLANTVVTVDTGTGIGGIS